LMVAAPAAPVAPSGAGDGESRDGVYASW
jgi:hypothetical protein